MNRTALLVLTACCICLILPVAHPPELASQDIFRSDVSLVDIHFNALDNKGNPVSGLTAGDFRILENGIEQEISFFSETGKREDVILTIALILDTSGSVKDKLGYEVTTATEFFREILRPEKDIALVMQFDSEVKLVQDFTQDLNLLENALDSLRAGGDTSLYDAIYLAAEEKLRYEAGRKVMVVISDGEDTSSLVSKEEAVESAQKSDAIIFGIGVRGSGSIGNFRELERFCEQTGGAFFSPRARFQDIQEAFLKIRQALQGQYSLAYSPRDRRKDGSYRAIEIRCKNRGIRIRARKGYYAPRENRSPDGSL